MSVTSAPLTRWAFALLVTVLLGTTGCTNSSTGSPLPTSPAEGSKTVSGSPSTSMENAAAKLAATDPCTLLTQAQLDQYGLQKRDSGNLAGARVCSWTHPTDKQGTGGYNLKPAIWDQQGIKDINTEGYIVSDTVAIGRHQARQVKQINGDVCAMGIGVTSSSRVDVVVAGDSDESCGLANQFAKLIEPKLPGGG